MRFATPFDGMDSADRPVISANRVVVSDPAEIDRIEQFLYGGGLAMGTRRRFPDVIEPSRGDVVYAITHTDGEWLWGISIGYCLKEHGVPLDPAFLEHIRRRGYVAAVPTEAQTRAALDYLHERARWASAPEVCIVRIPSDGDYAAAFVIDGRNYDCAEDFERVVREAFEKLNSRSISAEFETSSIGTDEPAFQLPSWEEYRRGRNDSDFIEVSEAEAEEAIAAIKRRAAEGWHRP